MKGILTCVFLLTSFTGVFAQQIYQSTEVETAANPGGGEDVFNHFIASNLRPPIKSSFRGLKGRVFVNAVVEPDGSLSNLSVLRGIDELCNKEAIRVLSLYKAWKPAIIKKEAVRQAVVLPVVFKSDPVESYDSTLQSLVHYFDKKGGSNRIDDQKNRRCIPVDDFGFINGDVLFQEKEGTKWLTKFSVPLKKEEFWKQINENGEADSISAVSLSTRNEQSNSTIYQVLQRDQKGMILDFSEYAEDGKITLSKSFFSTGAIREMTIYGNDKHQHFHWYENGLLSGIVEMTDDVFKRPLTSIIKEFYDRGGNQLVKNGNGYFVDQGNSIPGFDGTGEVRNGVKEGTWIAKSKDSTLLYEEFYEKGNLTKGTSFDKGEKFEYTEVEVMPEFSGGSAAMYRYLSQNIKYPKDAAKKNITGRVFTTFVVCEDGTLCDFKVLKGLHESIDNEAVRVLKGMSGKWEPGWQRGKKVKVKFNLPINFQLQ
ncbi:energy transducer TonB [Dyadobacter psychrotolerans]|nr:energy transducer TonB [Dyadobacter psychrotolerans]